MKVAVLSSTRATDMDGILDAINNDLLDAEISIVISNKQAPCLERAEKYHIKALYLDPTGKEREDYDKEIDKILKEHEIDLVLLIGYMKFMSPWFVNEWKHKVMNIHPSLLPAFAGRMDKGVHNAVLESGVKTTGATLHFIDETADGGPIIFQQEVSVDAEETVETLKKKVQAVEQELFVKALDLYQKGKITVKDNQVEVLGE